MWSPDNISGLLPLFAGCSVLPFEFLHYHLISMNFLLLEKDESLKMLTFCTVQLEIVFFFRYCVFWLASNFAEIVGLFFVFCFCFFAGLAIIHPEPSSLHQWHSLLPPDQQQFASGICHFLRLVGTQSRQNFSDCAASSTALFLWAKNSMKKTGHVVPHSVKMLMPCRDFTKGIKWMGAVCLKHSFQWL